MGIQDEGRRAAALACQPIAVRRCWGVPQHRRKHATREAHPSPLRCGAPQIAPRTYVVYAATNAAEADATGDTIQDGYSLLSAAKDACDAQDACDGITYSTTASVWRTFQGTLFDNTVAKVKVVGETINSWLPEPTP